MVCNELVDVADGLLDLFPGPEFPSVAFAADLRVVSRPVLRHCLVLRQSRAIPKSRLYDFIETRRITAATPVLSIGLTELAQKHAMPPLPLGTGFDVNAVRTRHPWCTLILSCRAMRNPRLLRQDNSEWDSFPIKSLICKICIATLGGDFVALSE